MPVFKLFGSSMHSFPLLSLYHTYTYLQKINPAHHSRQRLCHLLNKVFSNYSEAKLEFSSRKQLTYKRSINVRTPSYTRLRVSQFSSVTQSCPTLATPELAARQASLSITNSQSSLRLTSIESVMPSSHLILGRPLLLLPPIPPSIKVFSNESTLRMRWPKYWRLRVEKGKLY